MGANGQGGGRHRPLAFVAWITPADLEGDADHRCLVLCAVLGRDA